MHRLPRRILPILLAVIALSLTACQVPLPYLPVLPAEEEAVSAQDDLSDTAETEVAEAAEAEATEAETAETETTETETTEATSDTPAEDVAEEPSGDGEAVEAEETAAATDSEEATAAEEPTAEETEGEESSDSAEDSGEAAMPAESEGDETSDGEEPVAEETEGEESSDSGEAAMPAEPETEEASDSEMAEEAVVENPPVATILTRSLRIRSGPGAEYETVGGAAAGESFPILGQASGCEWLNVEHPTLGSVWLSGLAEYTSMNVACAQLSALEAVEDSASAEQETVAPDDAEAAAIEPTPEPQQEPAADQVEDNLPADQGCYLIQNQLGPDLNVTVTALDREWSDNFQIFEGEELPYCLPPGRYSVTIDAPPPWADLNDDLTVQAGDRFFWPIRSGE